MVPLLTLAAITIDASQWQVGANELQTIADAGALAASRAAQLSTPANASANAGSYAASAGSANTVFGQAGTIDAADVVPMTYSPSASPDTVAADWTSYNAIKVTARVSARRTLSGVVLRTAPTVQRTAVAWIASVNSSDCIIPWGLPYYAFYDIAASIAGDAASTAWPRPNLTQKQLAALTTASATARTVVIYGQTSGQNPQWIGYGYSGNNGRPHFQEAFWSCDAQKVTVGGTGGKTLSVNAGEKQECWALLALQGTTSNQCKANGDYLADTTQANETCFFKAPSGNTYDAGCYASPTESSPGRSQRVTWSDSTGHSGANALTYRSIGQLTIVCYFRGANSTATGILSAANKHESCTSGTTTYSDLPLGTMVVQVEGLSSTTLSSSVTLGTVPGNVQRLILVR